MEDKRICCHKRYDLWGVKFCGATAKIERDGNWYCKRHDPVLVKAKQDERNKAWEAEFQEKKKDSDYRYHCIQAFQSAASRLGISALDLAEALQDGGIADALELIKYAVDNPDFNSETFDLRCRAILAKIRKKGE